MKTPRQQEIKKNIMLAKFLMGAGGAGLGIRIAELYERLFKHTSYKRPIDMYDVVGTVVSVLLILIGVHIFNTWKKRKNEDQEAIGYNNDFTKE